MELIKNKQYVIGLLTIAREGAPLLPTEGALMGISRNDGVEENFIFSSVSSAGIYLVRDDNGATYQYSIFQVLPQVTINSNDLEPLLTEKYKTTIDTTLVWSKEGRKLSVDNFGETPGISQAISLMKMSI
jgi:hypothetical protein